MQLLKIGQLAREVDKLPSTIHFYTQEGLIHPMSFTRGGYRLYDKKNTIRIIREIEKLQLQKRLTINEIKMYFKNKNNQ